MMQRELFLKKFFIKKRQIFCLLFATILYEGLGICYSYGHTLQASSKRELRADSVTYSPRHSTLSAQGNVNLLYGPYILTAQDLLYDQKHAVIQAWGNACLTKPGQQKVCATSLVFSLKNQSASVENLALETAQATYFKAAQAHTMQSGRFTILKDATYTACQSCQVDPKGAVLWKIRAKRVVWDKTDKTLAFENSRFEFLGKPIIFLPNFKISDPSVKRKTGFLLPSVGLSNTLGASVTLPYFINLAPNYDLTLSETFLQHEGFLTTAQWRHLLPHGQYKIDLGYIYQKAPEYFVSGTVDSKAYQRFFLGSVGQFTTKKDWNIGWNLLYQSDADFTKSYGIPGYKEDLYTSRLYFQKNSARDHLDISFYNFVVQTQNLSDVPITKQQPFIFPVIDSLYYFKNPLYGGQVTWRTKSYIASRKQTGPTRKLYEPVGTHGHGMSEWEWKKNILLHDGLILTPLFAIRGDVWENFSSHQDENCTARLMGTAGLELRYPWVIQTLSAQHILEPVAQVFLRNNENTPCSTQEYANEDAQNFVFDASNLLQRDKFSGTDRIEGGSRANLALRYLSTFNNGWMLEGLIGQSFHLGGRNSFASADPSGLTARSGLDKNISDYVGFLGAHSKKGFLINTSMRVDNHSGKLHQLRIVYGKEAQNYAAHIHYTYSDAQPLHGYGRIRQEIGLDAGLEFARHWWLKANGVYDFFSRRFISTAGSLGYQDECFGALLDCERSQDNLYRKPSYAIHLRIGLRTLTSFPVF